MRTGEQAALTALARSLGSADWSTFAASGLPTMMRDGASPSDAALVAEVLAAGRSSLPFLGTLLAGELTAADGLPWGIGLSSDLSEPGTAVAFDGLGRAVGLQGLRVWVLEGGADLAATDLTRQLASAKPTAAVGDIDESAADRWRALALTLISADALGVMQGTLDAAVAHARTREQFGRPIGSFQAIQHLCADQLVLIEAARSAVLHAARAVETQPPAEALVAARLAKAWTAGHAVAVCEAAIQVWGGMGMTWDCPAHVYLRRAWLDTLALGDDEHQLAALEGQRQIAVNHDDEREAEFRAELRTWLRVHAPGGPVPSGGAERAAFWKQWHQTLYAGGWMGLSWPLDVGGRGLPSSYEAILNDEVGAIGAPPVPHVGFLGRGLLHAGTTEQSKTYLPGLLSGDETWCQGFSEPGAGSDLAALSTRAELVDGRYLVTGQKIWTSDAAWADWCLLLVRTDPDLPRHQGISALVVAMDSPGITVRPIIAANGDDEFNEVFFDEVSVPAANLVGRRGQGWALAMSTVSYERGPADIGFSSRFSGLVRELSQAPGSEGHRRDVTAALVATEILRLHVLRSLSDRADGADPGAAASLDKLLATRTDQQLHHLAMRIHRVGAVTGRLPEVLAGYLYSRGSSIYGGTSQIQRTIVAERLLGLPRGR